MKKLLTMCIVFFAAMTLIFAAEDPAEIVKKSREGISMDSVGTQSRMQIQNNGKTVNELVINQYSSKDTKGQSRTFIEFLAPANVKGTRFLMIEAPDGSMNQRIFMPNLGKVRRIAAESEGTASFMGTDFSYNDMAFLQRKSDLDNYTMLDAEKIDGKDCYLIEAKSKDKNYEYSKTLLWIQKDENRFLKAELYNKKGTLAKRLEMSNFESIQGHMTPRQTKITSLGPNTSTIININRIEYDMKIPEQVFTVRYLETGK